MFVNDIKEFILERLCKIHEEILSQDREYCELGKKPNGILQQLRAHLTSEQWKLFNEYDVAQNLQINRQDEVVYCYMWNIYFMTQTHYCGMGRRQALSCLLDIEEEDLGFFLQYSCACAIIKREGVVRREGMRI